MISKEELWEVMPHPREDCLDSYKIDSPLIKIVTFFFSMMLHDTVEKKTAVRSIIEGDTSIKANEKESKLEETNNIVGMEIIDYGN